MSATRVSPFQACREAVAFLRASMPRPPVAALVLGSGLDRLSQLVQDAHAIAYRDIPHFPASTAPGHRGELLAGHIAGVDLVVLRGRLHLYEGYTPQETVFPIRVLRGLGVATLILTNAAGGLNPAFQVGDVMLIRDHISLPGMAGLNPLRGPNPEAWGERFPALNQAYAPHLRTLALQLAAQRNIALQQGVYVYVAGPNFETPAEIRMLRLLGGDAVGMSTVPETTAARHAGMEVLALSTITNMCVDDDASTARPDSAEVIAAAGQAEHAYLRLLPALLSRLGSARPAAPR